MLLLLFALKALISLVPSVAAFNAAGCPRAEHALKEQAHGKQLPKYSSVDHYQGKDFLDDS